VTERSSRNCSQASSSVVIVTETEGLPLCGLWQAKRALGLAVLATLAGSYIALMDTASVDTNFDSGALRRIREDQNRADFMEFLYELDERGNPDHPYRHSYTGLYQDYAFRLGMSTLGEIAKQWHTYEIGETPNRAGRERVGEEAEP
jgi:hypothetical protein